VGGVGVGWWAVGRASGWTANAPMDRSPPVGPLTPRWTAVATGYRGPTGEQGSNGGTGVQRGNSGPTGEQRSNRQARRPRAQTPQPATPPKRKSHVDPNARVVTPGPPWFGTHAPAQLRPARRVLRRRGTRPPPPGQPPPPATAPPNASSKHRRSEVEPICAWPPYRVIGAAAPGSGRSRLVPLVSAPDVAAGQGHAGNCDQQ